MKKREFLDFRSLEVGISVIMSKSRGVFPYKSDGDARRLLKPKLTAARVVSVRFMTVLSNRSWEESVQKL